MKNILISVISSIVSGAIVYLLTASPKEKELVKQLTREKDSLRTAIRANADSLDKITTLYLKADSLLAQTLKDTVKSHAKHRHIQDAHATLPPDSATMLFLARHTGAGLP